LKSGISLVFGKEIAVEGRVNMRHFCRFGGNLWQKLPNRMLLAGVFAAVVGLAAGRTFLGSVAMVDGTSMEPTYHAGNWVFTAPISSPLERGDVVVIDDGNKDCAVKRIVGLPGETVHLWHGFVFVNRQILREPYVQKRTYTYRTQLGVFILGEGQYFVLGDNRINSIDSRAYGPVDRKQIKRRIPLPENSLRAHFDPYMIPTDGSSVPHRIASKMEGSKPGF
jgi:signal peptidase I